MRDSGSLAFSLDNTMLHGLVLFPSIRMSYRIEAQILLKEKFCFTLYRGCYFDPLVIVPSNSGQISSVKINSRLKEIK